MRHVVKYSQPKTEIFPKGYFYRMEDISKKDFKEKYQEATPHRPRDAEKIFHKRVRVYELKSEEWIRCSVSCKTKDVLGRKTDIDATVATKGDRPFCVRELQKLMKKKCGSLMPKTVYDSNDYWAYYRSDDSWSYLPTTAMDIVVGFEFPSEDEEPSEEAKVVSCR